VLDDSCPWVEVDIGHGVMMKCLEFPAACVHDIQLSAMPTIVYQHFKEVAKLRRVVELAIYAMYCPGYHCYYHLGLSHLYWLVASLHPSLDMYQLSMEKFKRPFGNPQVGQINPTSVDYEAVYLDEDGEMTNGPMDAVVNCILCVLKWINKKVASKKFHHVNIEEQFQKCLDNLREKGYMKTDFAKFQSMVAVQICCLAKVVVKGHKNLHNLVYPVSKLGAAAQLSLVHASSRKTRRAKSHHQRKWTGEIWLQSLCKTLETCFCNIFDYVFLDRCSLDMEQRRATTC